MAKLLVIDDEQGIRSLLDTLLSRKGYAVVLADGWARGLATGPQSQSQAAGDDLDGGQDA